jgi:hypothetical protein
MVPDAALYNQKHTCINYEILMNLDTLTTDQLRDRVEKLYIEHIKLCQDNFLYFVQKSKRKRKVGPSSTYC